MCVWGGEGVAKVNREDLFLVVKNTCTFSDAQTQVINEVCVAKLLPSYTSPLSSPPPSMCFSFYISRPHSVRTCWHSPFSWKNFSEFKIKFHHENSKVKITKESCESCFFFFFLQIPWAKFLQGSYSFITGRRRHLFAYPFKDTWFSTEIFEEYNGCKKYLICSRVLRV